MATAKTTVKKTATPVKASSVKGYGALAKLNDVDLSKPVAKKAPTKLELEQKIQALTVQLKSSEDMRLSAVQYRDKLAVEKGELARKNADLLKEKQDAKTEEGNLRRLIERQQADIEKLLGDNRTAKQFASDYAKQVEHLTSELSTAEAKLKNERADREHVINHNRVTVQHLKDAFEEKKLQLSKIPGWIRSIFGA